MTQMGHQISLQTQMSGLQPPPAQQQQPQQIITTQSSLSNNMFQVTIWILWDLSGLRWWFQLGIRAFAYFVAQ